MGMPTYGVYMLVKHFSLIKIHDLTRFVYAKQQDMIRV